MENILENTLPIPDVGLAYYGDERNFKKNGT